MIDRDLVQEFKTILEEYKTSPIGFRLRKTGSVLKLIEFNGLFYLDNENLFKIVNELLGPNVSDEIKEYIEKIVFSETVTIEKQNIQQTMILTCIQFVDYAFFAKCAEWIKERQQSYKLEDEFEQFFMDSLSSNINIYNNIFADSTPASDVNKMFPFKELWKFDDFDTSQKIKSETENSTQQHDFIMGKPRGKQMNLTKESLKERPYMCEMPFCDRAFKRFEHLKRHMKMHTGDRPYKCPFPGCSKSFSRSDNLNQHAKIHSTGGRNREPMYFNTFGKTL